MCLWEMDTLDLLNTIALPGPVEMLDISVDSMFLLVLCEGNQLWLHALATGTLIHNLKGYCSKVMSIALAEDCQRAVVAGVDSRVYIYDIHSGDLDLVPISTSPHHKEVIAVKITKNDDFLVTAGKRNHSILFLYQNQFYRLGEGGTQWLRELFLSFKRLKVTSTHPPFFPV